MRLSFQGAIVYFRSLRHTRTKMTTAMIAKMSSPIITAKHYDKFFVT